MWKIFLFEFMYSIDLWLELIARMSFFCFFLVKLQEKRKRKHNNHSLREGINMEHEWEKWIWI